MCGRPSCVPGQQTRRWSLRPAHTIAAAVLTFSSGSLAASEVLSPCPPRVFVACARGSSARPCFFCRISRPAALCRRRTPSKEKVRPTPDLPERDISFPTEAVNARGISLNGKITLSTRSEMITSCLRPLSQVLSGRRRAATFTAVRRWLRERDQRTTNGTAAAVNLTCVDFHGHRNLPECHHISRTQN